MGQNVSSGRVLRAAGARTTRAGGTVGGTRALRAAIRAAGYQITTGRGKNAKTTTAGLENLSNSQRRTVIAALRAAAAPARGNRRGRRG